MRLTVLACSIVLFSALASAQVNVVSGYAGYVPYAGPFVPLLTTPSVSWGPGIPASGGARNATWGNHAGARNATVETLPRVEYNRTIQFDREFREDRGPELRHEEHEVRGMEEQEREHAHPFRSGVAVSDFSQGLAQLVNKSSSATKASRTYTNQDVTRMNDANGTVKYDGKTQHI